MDVRAGRLGRSGELAAAGLLILLAVSVAMLLGNPGVSGVPVAVLTVVAIAGAILFSQLYAGYLILIFCSFTFISSGKSAAFTCCSSVRRRFRSITTLWKNVSIGHVLSCKPGVPGRRTSVPFRHFSAGAAGVMPVSSRITRRSSSSRSSA